MRKFLFVILCFSYAFYKGQDSVYARQVIKKLSSKEFYGRGYLNNGLDLAAKYLVEELKKFKAQPLFATGYYQWFDHDVNTFPGKMNVKLDGKVLKPGEDFIVSPESKGIKGKFKLIKKDSANFIAEGSALPLVLNLKKKLTF